MLRIALGLRPAPNERLLRFAVHSGAPGGFGLSLRSRARRWNRTAQRSLARGLQRVNRRLLPEDRSGGGCRRPDTRHPPEFRRRSVRERLEALMR
jgi:hypothetical protein